jgi:hypothetical protein
VLSGRGLCDGLINRTEESYRVGCVVSMSVLTVTLNAVQSLGKLGRDWQ